MEYISKTKNKKVKKKQKRLQNKIPTSSLGGKDEMARKDKLQNQVVDPKSKDQNKELYPKS